MELRLSKKAILSVFLLVIAVVFSYGLLWGYENYKEDVAKVFFGKSEESEDENKEYKEVVEDGIPFSADATWNIGYVYDEVKDVRFWIFQPKVAEYRSENGVNYLIGEYTFEEGLDAEMMKVKIVLSRGDDWSIEAEGLDRAAFEKAVGAEVPMEVSFHPANKDYLVEETTTLEDFKKEFPVGERVAVKIPMYYPAKDARSDSYCDSFTNACSFAPVWDALSTELEDFNSGEPISDKFIVVPKAFSSSIYTLGDE